LDLEARGVSHRYGEMSVLEQVGFEVGSREVVAIVGPSGCGKSTLLNILGGLLEPTSGEVRLRGEAGDGCLNPLTFVFQDFALLPWRTVAGNVSLPLESHTLGRSEREGRVSEALERAGLADFAGAFPRQLSGGMRQRVGIARALVVRPAIMLLDEPLSALDSQTRHLLRDELRQLWDELAAAAVYVTHDLWEAVCLADRILVMSRRPGRLRTSVEVPLERAARDRDNPAAVQLEQRLWELLRDEAADADREVLG
jgi:NitT/TauT family transport system ATP-binding protein